MSDSDIVDLNLYPITSLSRESKYLLSCLLNPKKVLSNSDGLPRDWRGLASLIKISSEMAAFINDPSVYDKTSKVLEQWIQNGDRSATIGQLLEFLQRLDRYDIYDDLQEIYQRGQLIAENELIEGKQITKVQKSQMQELITYDDKKYGYPQDYHAYVLFAREDQTFVVELLKRMQAKGFKLCTEDDLLPGHTTQYVPVSKLLMDRCRRIILIYSEKFFTKPSNRFFIDYAQAVSIEFRGDVITQPKLIPIVLRKCDLPENVTFYHKLYVGSEDERPIYDFWVKLEEALNVTDIPRMNRLNGTNHSQISMQDYVRNKLYLPLPLPGANGTKKSYSEFLSNSMDLWAQPKKTRKKAATEIMAPPSIMIKSSSTQLLQIEEVHDDTSSSSTKSLNTSEESRERSLRKRIRNMFKSKPKIILPD